jgi:ABC-2 type transport system ATP-binding protein
MQMKHILEGKNINKFYDNFRVLKDINISIPEGQIFGLLGPNGAGKTTLIRTLTQITAPDSGEIIYKGLPLKAYKSSEFGYLPEERGLYRKMKVGEQALYLCQIKGLDKKEALHKLKPWFEKLAMESWWNRKVEELSKGMQQKLQFAITVAHSPKLLILDEPFSGFDPVNTETIKNHILDLKNEGTTIVFSTHNMASVEELCQNITLINRGENILSGSVNDIRKSFSKSLFQVQFKGSKVAFANALGYQFEIDEIIETPDHTNATVLAHNGSGSKELLTWLIQHVEVISFHEKLPSMNDIFLDLVGSLQNETRPS